MSRQRECFQVMSFLRDHRGEKFSATELAEATGLGLRTVSNVLTTRFAHHQSRLQRERSALDHTFKYWIPDTAANASATKEGREIARWLLGFKHAARPSMVAMALTLDVDVVARELEQMAREGKAVRCALLLRTGHDRFEYRLAHGSPSGDDRHRYRAPAFSERVL